MFSKLLFFIPILLISTVFIGGCSAVSVDLDSAQHEKTLHTDRAALQENEQISKELKLSIEEALERAVHNNLDARVSALELLSAQDNITLEKIKALPSMKYTLARNGRSNSSASSSLSALTGQESLESSISSERYRNTRDVTLNWNIIDTASTLMQVRAASDRATITQERYKKVIQNIHRDVYAAYWRAIADDKARIETKKLIDSAQKYIGNIDKAAAEKLISKSNAAQRKLPYYEAISILETLQNQSGLAKIELKSLLNFPQSTHLILTSKALSKSSISQKLLKIDMETLELSALRRRPEMREAFLEKNISIRNTKEEIIRTLPGAEVFFALNRDNNKFLANDRWRSYSVNLVQSITNFLSFPDRYLIARKNEALSEARRITLSAAIIAQVNIARHGLIYANNLHQIDIEKEKAAQQQSFAVQKKMHSGYASKGDALLTKMRAQEKKLQSYQSFAVAQDSYATFVNTLGFEVSDRISLDALKGRAS